MSRPSPLPRLVLLACAAALPLGCKTVYHEMYSPRANHFHPPVEKKETLPQEKKAPAPVQALPPPGAAAAGGIPGLAPVPDIGGLPMPAPAAPAP